MRSRHCVYVTKPCELIVGADMNLDGIGSFVSSIRPSANTRVMILENSGLIVAATNSLVAVYGVWDMIIFSAFLTFLCLCVSIHFLNFAFVFCSGKRRSDSSSVQPAQWHYP